MNSRSFQRYGSLAADDRFLKSSSSDSDSPLPPRRPFQPPSASTAPLSTHEGLQQALDAHPPLPRVNMAALVVIRAFPILATFSWLLTLTSLLLIWLILDDHKTYIWYLGGLPFLSDVGAEHKTVFLVGNILTAVFLTLSVWQERLLRTKRVMAEATEERLLWTVLGVVDVVVAGLAGCALLLLAVFDAFQFPVEHNAFMLTFIGGVAIGGNLNTLEVEHLWHEHPDRHDLRDGTVLKWFFLGFAGLSGAAYLILYYLCDGDATKVKDGWAEGSCYRITTASAITEWLACFLIVFYLSTLILDVWPVHRHLPVVPRAWADRTGVRGVWIPMVHGEEGEAEEGREWRKVEVPGHLEVRRWPASGRGEGEGDGGRTAVVVEKGSRGEAGIGEGGWEWYSEGKRREGSGKGRRA